MAIPRSVTMTSTVSPGVTTVCTRFRIEGTPLRIEGIVIEEPHRRRIVPAGRVEDAVA